MPRQYSPEFRQRALRMLDEALPDHVNETAAINHVASRLGVVPETLRKWRQRYEIDAGHRSGRTSEELAEIRALKRENAELKRAKEDTTHCPPRWLPSTVRVLRSCHAWEGRSLELLGWMRRGGRLELILVLPDGSHLMVPAAWTDLNAPAGRTEVGTVGSLDDLLAARRILEPCLSVSSWPSGMIAVERSSVQLRLELAESPAPAVALWELVGEEQRQAAMALLAALIAPTVAGEEPEQEARVGE